MFTVQLMNKQLRETGSVHTGSIASATTCLLWPLHYGFSVDVPLRFNMYMEAISHPLNS